MELDLFKSFVAVAETRSFRRAAQILHATQPTLSRRIARLESELGTQLFERYGRHVECTNSGQTLLPVAQSIIARVADTVSHMRTQGVMSSGVVRFGASGILVAHFLAPILVKFEAAYPTTCVELVEREDVELEGKVLSGELDCAVVTPWRSSRAAARYLSTEEIMAVLPIAHRLATKSAVTLNMLRNEPLLLPSPGMNLFRVITDAFHRAGIEPKIGHQSGYPELSLNLARMGLGVAPMPRMLVSSKVREDLVAVPFRESVARDLVIIYSWDRPLSAATRALVTHIQQELLPPAGRVAEFRERWDRSRRPRRAMVVSPDVV